MRFTTHTLHLEFLDGETEQIRITTRGESINPGVVEDGVLHVYDQNGEYAPREHVGSWPLCNIKKYQFKEWQPGR